MSTATQRRALGRAGIHVGLLGVRRALWESRSLGATAAVGLGAAAAFASSIPLPRGPVTTSQGLVVILASIAVGVGAGAAMRSRWAAVVAPLAYIVTYELARAGIRGASLEGIRLDSANGIAALVAGRGVHGLLALFPMVVGVAFGVALVRPAVPGRNRGRSLVALIPRALLALSVIGLAAIVAMPPSTPPVLGADGRAVSGSIAELGTVRLGGHDQGISVRAADPDKPVLLYLSGGPGQSDLAYGRALLEPLTADFVVVVWDQRGNGTSYSALDPTATLTLGQAVADTIQLAEHLRQRFDEAKVYLVGESWGSTLGVLAVQQRPDLFHAYIGSGQMVSQRETDRIIWRDLLAYAERSGDWALYDRVLTMGEPPYRDMPWANSFVMGYYDALATPYTPPAAYTSRGEAAGIGPFGVLASEYAFIDKANVLRGLVDVFSLMYPQLQDIDFRRDVTRMEVPVYLLDGANELRGRRDLALAWFSQLSAPSKQLVTFAHAGHATLFEEVDAVRVLLNEVIVPSTYRVR